VHRPFAATAWLLASVAACLASLRPSWAAPAAVLALGGFGLAAAPSLAVWSRVVWPLGAGAVAAGLAMSGPAQWALAVLGLAALLVALAAGSSRMSTTLLAAGLAAVAAALPLLGHAGTDAAVVAVPAIGLLALQASWSRAGTGWDLVPLGAVVAASAGASLAFAAAHHWLRLEAAWMAGLALPLAAAGLAALTCPWPAPKLLRPSGPWPAVASHGIACLALLNVGFLALSLSARWSIKAILLVLLGWQAIMLTMEYRAVLHAGRKLRQATPPVPALDTPVTVVVPAFDDAACLADSLRHNLAVPHDLRFVLVPAARSSDGTLEVCRRAAAANPGRARVVVGDTRSKAGDLNKAWAAVETDAVLLLDADETIDADSLRWGLARLAEPGVGVVQGRKVSRAPDDGFLARFVSSERRYSTWLDQVLHADQLGSSHFGGSAALLRRDVVPAVGGWTDRTLTEDIEFTLRTHLDGRWRIALETRMVVREADPRTFADLLRQRTRWSRGWAQNLDLYLGPVVRSRRRLGNRRTFGLVLLLLIAVSALWTTFVPATMLMRLGGVSPLLPLALAVPLSLLLLPSRLLAYGFAALRDPVIPLKATPRALAELALQAYLWILLGWLVQLHALYLEVSRSPRTWDVTGKRSSGAPAAVPA